jgi:glycosyltransferase involved in cell wall biosynthesis
MRLSIIICTYNRAHIILQCLPTIISEIIKHPFIEVIIVDNNSKDNTNEVISSFLKVTPNIKYIIEEQIGLSYARNRGYKEADSGWVIYIDDDAKIQEGYINRLLLIISNYDFDCFGGMYYSWYLYGKPRWLPENFGNKESLRPDVGLIDGSTGWLSGGNFAIKKAVLKAVGGFNPELGMSGNNIGYGEEDYLQQQLFEEGYKIGFDPNLVIDHLVLPHKLALSWHLNSTLKHKKASVKLKK